MPKQNHVPNYGACLQMIGIHYTIICQSGGSTPGPETVCPITPLSQIATMPESLCQRMSLLWLPSKSPTPAICQLLGTEVAIVDGFVDCPLFQIVTAPVTESCQRISVLPLPSK